MRSRHDIQRSLRRTRAIFTVGAAAIGAVALSGWLLSVRTLERVVFGQVPMKANTAISMLLLSGALLGYRAGVSKRGHMIAVGGATLAAVIALATLSEYVLGWHLGIDQLLFSDRKLPGAPYPGRPSFNAALGLLLVAGAILSLDVRLGRWWPSHLLASAAGTLGLLALAGVATETTSLADLATGQAIAWTSAIGLALLSGAVLLARLEHGVMVLFSSPRSGGVVLRWAWPVAVAAPVVVAGFSQAAEQAGFYSQRVRDWTFVTVVMGVLATLIWALARAIERRSVDISLRKRAEDLYRGLLESAPDAIVVVDSTARIVLVNAQTEAMFGYDRDELLGQPIGLLIPESLRKAHAVHVDAFVVAPRPRAVGIGRQLAGRRRDGSEFPAEISLNPLETDEGTLISSAIRDVTERTQAEEARAWLAEIVESSSEAIVGVAPSGTIQSWNPGAERLYGYSCAEAIGKPVTIMIPPERAEKRTRALKQVLADEATSVEQETEDLTSDGRRIAVAVTDTPIRDTTGRIIGVARVSRDITDRKRLEQELEFNSDHDPLTGVFNRRRFTGELARAVAYSARYPDAAGSLLLVDVDNFKDVNDALGHRAGDQLLEAIAGVLAGRLRKTDVFARVGGDEFAAVLAHTPLEAAEAVARSLSEAVGGLPTIVNGRKVHTTLSVGVAPLGNGMTGEDSMVLADLAMYDAKRQGPGRVVAFSEKPKHVRDQLSRAERLHEALKLERFELYAQPIIDVASGRTQHQELLLRLRDDNDQLVLPGEFIGTAERVGLIAEIDRWVVRRAIGLLGRQPGGSSSYAVNLSAISISDRHLLPLIASEIDRAHVDPARLVFEVTETAAITDMDTAREFIHGLRRIGCSSALDDFGSGFASLAHLKHLPVDYLKIDGEFVSPLPGTAQDRALVKAIVEVAHSLNRRTIAEHVGSAEAMSVLRDYGADFAQGYYLGMPCPLELVEDELRATG